MTARRVFHGVWPPVLFGAAFIALWQLAVGAFDFKPYFLPPPSSVSRTFVDNIHIIRKVTWVSGSNAFAGLVVGTALGIAMSFALMRFRVLNEMVTPLAIGLNAVPIVVLVSVFNNQFQSTSEIPRRLMVTLIVYFVVLVNVAKGLRQVQPTQLELMRSYAASPMAVIRKVRVPNAVPYLFTALKIAAPGAVITAFVAEYFGGNQNGLGSRIAASLSGDKSPAFAYVVAAMLLGLAFYLASVGLESLTTTQRGATPQGEST